MRAKAQSASHLSVESELYLAPAYYKVSEEDGIPRPTMNPLKEQKRFLVVPAHSAVKAFRESAKAQGALSALRKFKFFNAWGFTVITIVNFMAILINFAQVKNDVDPLVIAVHVVGALFGLAGLAYVGFLKRLVRRAQGKFLALGARPVLRAFWDEIDQLDESTFPDPEALYSVLERVGNDNEDPSALLSKIEKVLRTDMRKNEVK